MVFRAAERTEMKKKKHKKFRRHDDLRGFSGKEYIRSQGRRQLYKTERIWTKEKRRLFKTGLQLLDDGIRVEVVIGVIRGVGNV
jgi:hypothetical protein